MIQNQLPGLLNIFSGVEVDTGMKFVDGKEIYAKTLNIGTVSAAEGTYTHNIGYSSLVTFTGTFEAGAYWNVYNYFYLTGDYNSIIYDHKSTSFKWRFASSMWSRNPKNIVVTLFYTR